MIKTRKGEQPLVMMKMKVMTRVIVVVTVAAVMVDDDDSSTNSDYNSSRSYDSPYSEDDWGEPPSDREDEDADLFYEEYDSDVDHYDYDI